MARPQKDPAETRARIERYLAALPQDDWETWEQQRAGGTLGPEAKSAAVTTAPNRRAGNMRVPVTQIIPPAMTIAVKESAVTGSPPPGRWQFASSPVSLR